MRIAIPLVDGKVSMHFGHCEAFCLMDIDQEEKKIIRREDIAAPPHQPGLLPPWLSEHGAAVIIASAMGQRALRLFADQGIEVVPGAQADTPERLAGDYLAGNLESGANPCDH